MPMPTMLLMSCVVTLRTQDDLGRPFLTHMPRLRRVYVAFTSRLRRVYVAFTPVYGIDVLEHCNQLKGVETAHDILSPPHDPDLLLALAWTAPVDNAPAARLVAPAAPLRTSSDRLTACGPWADAG